MAVDSQSNHQPNPYRPARDRAPAGTQNTSKAASGGQDYTPGDIAPTPSMRVDGKAPGSTSTAQPGPERAPGNPPSD